MTMTNLPPLAETLRLITAAYFVADVTARKHFDAIFQQLQSLTEYELAKQASRNEAAQSLIASSTEHQSRRVGDDD